MEKIILILELFCPTYRDKQVEGPVLAVEITPGVSTP